MAFDLHFALPLCVRNPFEKTVKSIFDCRISTRTTNTNANPRQQKTPNYAMGGGHTCSCCYSSPPWSRIPSFRQYSKVKLFTILSIFLQSIFRHPPIIAWTPTKNHVCQIGLLPQLLLHRDDWVNCGDLLIFGESVIIHIQRILHLQMLCSLTCVSRWVWLSSECCFSACFSYQTSTQNHGNIVKYFCIAIKLKYFSGLWLL